MRATRLSSTGVKRHRPGIPRFGFALCLPVKIDYVNDSRTFIGFDFHARGVFSGKHLLHFCACCVDTSLFMSGLQMPRRRKDAFFDCQRFVVRYQK
jgi:hypothetical protein